MTGIIMDVVLLLLLVAAVGYGVKLERKLTALRAGQLAFASAVTELNSAASRAEAALATLRASGQETDLLHDRIIKAREVKAQLETLIARAPTASIATRIEERPAAGAETATPVAASVEDDDRARRMAALAERIQGLAGLATSRRAAAAPEQNPGAGNVAAILQAMTANQSAKQSLNAARRSLDDDLFAA